MLVELELRDVLSDTQENNTLLRRDTVFAQLNFSLNSSMFTLLNDEKHTNSGNHNKEHDQLHFTCIYLF